MQHAADLAAATPDTRNRYVDLLRLVAIGVVVFGHWLISIVGIDAGGSLTGTSLLTEASWTGYLSWIFQVMPVFFIVGAFANLGSIDSAARRGIGYVDWVRARIARLLRPTVVFVGVWLAAVAVLQLAGLDAGVIAMGGRVVTIPLWFLAVYVLTVAAAPAMARAHRRWGAGVVVVALVATIVVDRLGRFGDLPLLGYANYAFVWLGIHQLGFFWQEGRVGRRTAAALAASGAALVVGLTQLGPYPVSMVGVENANTQPPSLALFALGIMQFGLILLAEERANRMLRNTRLWTVTIAGNSMIMSLYLWHFTALVIASVGLVATGIWPQAAPLSSQWWLLHGVWMLVLSAALVPFLLLFARFERSVPDQGSGGGTPLLTVVGVLSLVAGMAMLTSSGFHVAGQPLGLPWPAIGALATGAALVRPRLFDR